MWSLATRETIKRVSNGNNINLFYERHTACTAQKSAAVRRYNNSGRGTIPHDNATANGKKNEMELYKLDCCSTS